MPVFVSELRNRDEGGREQRTGSAWKVTPDDSASLTVQKPLRGDNDMKTNLVRILALSAIAAAVGSAQVNETQANARRVGDGVAIVGIWDVAVTVVNCQTGVVLRNVRSVQMYQADGAFSETTSLGTRGGSIGSWVHQQGQNYSANYFFFRYNPDGSFASIAKAANTITVSPDSNEFSVTAMIQDYDANNNLLSTGCVTQTAKKL
jgi:hypothetical protein